MAIPNPQQNSTDQAQFALNLKGIGNKNSLFYRHFHFCPRCIWIWSLKISNDDLPEAPWRIWHWMALPTINSLASFKSTIITESTTLTRSNWYKYHHKAVDQLWLHKRKHPFFPPSLFNMMGPEPGELYITFVGSAIRGQIRHGASGKSSFEILSDQIQIHLGQGENDDKIRNFNFLFP